MTVTNDTPDDTLAHYGVKGMRWGHRKPSDENGSESSGSSEASTPKKGLTDGQKKALRYAAGGALVAGALITTALLAKNGKIPVSGLRSPLPSAEAKAYAAKTKHLDALAIQRNAEQAARQQIARNLGGATRRAEEGRRNNAVTRRIDEVAIRNNAAQARRKATEANLAAELTRRSEANLAASVARGEAMAARLGMSPEAYWQRQVADFRKQNYQDTEEYR